MGPSEWSVHHNWCALNFGVQLHLASRQSGLFTPWFTPSRTQVFRILNNDYTNSLARKTLRMRCSHGATSGETGPFLGPSGPARRRLKKGCVAAGPPLAWPIPFRGPAWPPPSPQLLVPAPRGRWVAAVNSS